MNKPYPPSIEGVIPAFYKDDKNDSGATIKIPFIMNKSVSKNDIEGFYLKVKTIQSNEDIAHIPSATVIYNEDGVSGIAYFNIVEQEQLEKIQIGQFLKVQLAYAYSANNSNGYVDESDLQGYYSTVGITKYTTKPNIIIDELKDKPNGSTYPLLCNYTGIYNSEDITEKPNQQKFSLYKGEELLEESDWFLYDINNENNNTFNFQTLLLSESEPIQYTIKYNINTLNGLEEEISYELYTPTIQESVLPIKLKAENNFDDSYIKIFFKEDGWSFSDWNINITEEQLNIASSSTQDDIFNQVNNINNEKVLEVISLFSNDSQDISIENNTLLLKNFIFPFTNEPNSILKIYRSDLTHNFQNWKEVSSFNVNKFPDIFQWFLKDFNIEQGETYRYAFKEYKVDITTLDNQLFYSNDEYADFEDSFLYDGEKQLKIRLNPQVSSFKINRLEQKTETIGSQFPFIFRNATVKYAEFPISGLISYHMDNNEEFVSKEELGIISTNKIERTSNPEQQQIKNIETTNITDYNIRAERLFKLKLLNWLENGEIKLFKSPTEGNYLVRLMNISLSPEKQVNRMLHDFSCTAYEIQEYNYKNLFKLNFIKINN